MEDPTPSDVNTIGGVYIGSFAITTMLNPKFFHGTFGVLPYFNMHHGAIASFYARGMGCAALSLASGAVYAPRSKVINAWCNNKALH